MNTCTLACGPFITQTGLWAAVVVFFVLKPAAYFGFIQAFRYRVCRSIPMTFAGAARLTLARAALGVGLFAVGAAVVVATESPAVAAWSWLYLYAGRAAAWFVVGWWGAVLRGRRLVGWIISGTLINAAFDLAAVMGLLGSWVFPAVTLAGLAVFIAALTLIGRRDSLKARFTTPTCRTCGYDLTGNLSGRCPECSAAIAQAA